MLKTDIQNDLTFLWKQIQKDWEVAPKSVKRLSTISVTGALGAAAVMAVLIGSTGTSTHEQTIGHAKPEIRGNALLGEPQ